MRHAVNQTFAAISAALASDCLDRLGFRDHVLDPRVVALEPGMRVVGPAHTLLASDQPGDASDPYAGEIAAVDAIGLGTVVVISTCREAAIWGELLATSATARGAVGVVSDAPVRDTQQLCAMGFATFCVGASPRDSQGRVSIAAHNVAITCAGVEIAPGDLIVGDRDGVVAIPQQAIDEVVRLAAEKLQGEDTVRAALAAGQTLRSVFDDHRIL